jgi:hypothetical protein
MENSPFDSIKKEYRHYSTHSTAETQIESVHVGDRAKFCEKRCKSIFMHGLAVQLRATLFGLSNMNGTRIRSTRGGLFCRVGYVAKHALKLLSPLIKLEKV